MRRSRAPTTAWASSPTHDGTAVIRLVLFDLDDTLFAHREAVEEGVRAHRRATGLGGDDRTEFARWNALEEEHYHRYLAGEIDFLEQRRERVRGFLGPHGVVVGDDDADAWFTAYLEHYRQAWSLHADALPLLEELDRSSIRTGIITNGDLGFQTSKLVGLELDGRFEHVIASGEVGVAKPDARIFEHACALYDVPPADALYVGDRLGTDAIGAHDAGLTGVWLARGGTDESQRLAARAAGVHVIGTLAELPPLCRP